SQSRVSTAAKIDTVIEKMAPATTSASEVLTVAFGSAPVLLRTNNTYRQISAAAAQRVIAASTTSRRLAYPPAARTRSTLTGGRVGVPGTDVGQRQASGGNPQRGGEA